jgi:protein-S-isoprenylcysteine O-methyltransferase Ste14
MPNWNVFDIIYLIFIAITFIIRMPYAKISRSTKIIKSQVDLGEKIGLPLAFLGGFFLPIIYFFSPLFNFADYAVPQVMGWTGAFICLPAIWLFLRSHKDLGRQWSPKLELREEHKLITTGVYEYIRHPMYTAVFLCGLAQILLIGNWLVGPSYLVGFGILYFSRIRREEDLMAGQFGAEYTAYKKRTSRLFSLAFLAHVVSLGH